eukprot:jgi/Galph1/3903/GphlegSOOS_G2569.1
MLHAMANKTSEQQGNSFEEFESRNSQIRPLRREPISLEDILERKKQEEEASWKPKFVGKSERERQALQRLYERRGAAPLGEGQRSDNLASNKEPVKAVAAAVNDRAKNVEPSLAVDKESLHMRDILRKHYMKEKESKTRITKPSERFRFRFEWDNSEDTVNLDEIPDMPSFEIPLLFGRGHRGGMDTTIANLQKSYQSFSGHSNAVKGDNVESLNNHEFSLEDPVHRRHKKDMRHWSDKTREEMTERDWRIFREDHSIAYRGGRAPFPARNWKETGLPSALLHSIERIAKYKHPTPIQMAAIPIGLAKRDMIGLAETGSGKTAAFVLPMLVYISQRPPMTPANAAQGPYAIILVPTRELAQQIEEETKKFAGPLGYRVCSVVGGVSIEEQGMKLREGVEIVIATPGRMIDCLERRYCVLNQCDYVVLDEADRMIDMGFEPQVQGVLDAMPPLI